MDGDGSRHSRDERTSTCEPPERAPETPLASTFLPPDSAQVIEWAPPVGTTLSRWTRARWPILLAVSVGIAAFFVRDAAGAATLGAGVFIAAIVLNQEMERAESAFPRTIALTKDEIVISARGAVQRHPRKFLRWYLGRTSEDPDFSWLNSSGEAILLVSQPPSGLVKVACGFTEASRAEWITYLWENVPQAPQPPGWLARQVYRLASLVAAVSVVAALLAILVGGIGLDTPSSIAISLQTGMLTLWIAYFVGAALQMAPGFVAERAPLFTIVGVLLPSIYCLAGLVNGWIALVLFFLYDIAGRVAERACRRILMRRAPPSLR